jgi:hypothetical protein
MCVKCFTDTQQFRHELEVQYGVVEQQTSEVSETSEVSDAVAAD